MYVELINEGKSTGPITATIIDDDGKVVVTGTIADSVPVGGVKVLTASDIENALCIVAQASTLPNKRYRIRIASDFDGLHVKAKRRDSSGALWDIQ